MPDISYKQTIYDLQKIDFGSLCTEYLMYVRVTDLSLDQQSKSRFIRIVSYIIKETSVQYISSWLFFVSFLFLLANKLAVELSLRNALFRIINGKKRCDANGRCRVSSV